MPASPYQRTNPRSYPSSVASAFFLELGLGGIPLRDHLDALPQSFTGWIIVEVDQPSMDPLVSARTSWAWIERNFPAL
jgi:inosose dehydratase